jgi:hypothetical protein
MPKGPFGFPRLTALGPFVSADGGRPEGLIPDARIRDHFLLVKRNSDIQTFEDGGKDRATVRFPSPLVEPLGYDTTFRTEPNEDDYSEFLVVPDPSSSDANYRGAGNRSSIRFNGETTEKLPFDFPTELVLDIDLRNPDQGMLVRGLKKGEGDRFRAVRKEEYLPIIESGK